MNLGNAEENRLFVVNNEKRYFATANDINPEVENSSLSYIIKAITDNSTVVDVGCSYGYLGEWLAKNKNCQVYGIDIDEDALEYVKERGYYKDVFHLDLDYPQNTKDEFERFGQLKEIFDFAIYADVLEHLKNPTNALDFISSKLKLGGQVLISIPNVAHMDIILNLLESKFNYSEFGVLDNTHLRFFTKKSFAEWINNSNEFYKGKGFKFDAKYLGGTTYISEFLKEVKNNHAELYNKILGINNELEILQHIFVLTKVNSFANTYGLNELLSDTNYVNAFYNISEEIQNIKSDLNNKEIYIKDIENKYNEANSKLEHIYNSHGWSILLKYYKIRDAILPEGSRRRKIFKAVLKLPRLFNKSNIRKGISYIRMYGLKAFLRKIKIKLLSQGHIEKANIEYENSMQISEVIDLLLLEPLIPHVSIVRPIDILIPIYNGREFLDSLFASIVKNTFVPYRLLIANDKSTDPNISKYLADFKNNNPNIDITVIENKDNLGFVKTVNKLAKLTKNHFVILNTDTEVPPHWLERLIFPIIAKENIASVTPFTNAGTICSFPDFLIDNSIFEDMDIATLDSYFQYVDFERNYVEIPTAVGFCMAINKKVYDKIGLFDESFGKGYGEENDWSMRAAKAGYKNIIAPNLFVYHKHGGSFLNEEKKKLMDNNSALLKDKYPNYFLLVEDFIRKDPLKYLRTILKIKILSTLYKPIMILDHSLGGGANEYTNTLAEDKPLAIIIKYDLKVNKYIVEFYGQKIEKLSFKMEDIKEIKRIIKYFNVEEVIINELVSYPKILDILDFLVELKSIHNNINYIFMVHDFFCVCPMYNLLNYEIKYCDVPSDLNYCDKCIKLNPLIESQVPFIKQDYPNLTISLWRERFGGLLEYSSKIICFSQNSKEILEKAYPNLSEDKFKIKFHSVDWIRAVTINKTSETINIAILGHLTIHKGAHIVASLISYIDYYKINIKIHIFGDILEPYESFGFIKTVVKHGRYKKADLPKLMEENEIDIVFMSSICPETFSFTTEEAIKMGLPVAVFNIGAPAERVKIYDKGIILQKQDPEYIVRTICKYFNKNIIVNTKKKEDIVFVCVSNNDLIYSRAIHSSAYMTEHKILKYDNTEENIPIPIRYNDAINKLLASNYSGWIFFVHNDFSIMEPIDNIVNKLEHTHLYGPIGAILKGSGKIIYGQILQGHKEGLIYHGSKIDEPTLVNTVDCQCLFLHTDLLKKYNLRFDENRALSFHQYVEDFCLNANVNYGIKTYAVPMKCKHFSWGKLNNDFNLAIVYINSKYHNKKWGGTCTHVYEH